jgi:hypothetical protein
MVHAVSVLWELFPDTVDQNNLGELMCGGISFFLSCAGEQKERESVCNRCDRREFVINFACDSHAAFELFLNSQHQLSANHTGIGNSDICHISSIPIKK